MLTQTPRKARSTKKVREISAASAWMTRVTDLIGAVPRSAFYTALSVVLVASLVVVLQTVFDDELPTLRMEEAVSSPAAAPDTPISAYTVLVSTYSNTERGLTLAYEAQAELLRRGFPDATVLGWPDPDAPGQFRHYEVVVGVAASPEQLAVVHRRLMAVDDWPGGEQRPFSDARIVAHPDPAVLGG